MIDFAVIGSGISGATISNKLNKKYSIKVFEKAKGVGGRSSFKRHKEKVGFDHGLQYISPRSKEFKSFTKKLIKKRVIKCWTGNHKFLNEKNIHSNFLGYKLQILIQKIKLFMVQN